MLWTFPLLALEDLEVGKKMSASLPIRKGPVMNRLANAILNRPRGVRSKTAQAMESVCSDMMIEKGLLRMKPGRKPRLPFTVKGDIAGGLAAAVISLPMSIGYGLLAFAPLGPGYAPHAALAGVYSCIFAGLTATLLGGTAIQITGPGAPLALVLSAFVAEIIPHACLPNVPSINIGLVLGLSSCVILAGAVFQLIFGALHLGRLIRYLPYPVVSGLMNGIAVLVIVRQLKPLLGLQGEASVLTLLSQPSLIDPASALLGVATLLVLAASRGVAPALPAAIIGVTAGTALYLTLDRVVAPMTGVVVIGSVPIDWPNARNLLNLIEEAKGFDLWHFVPSILASGFCLALLGTIESLLSAAVADELTGGHHRSDRELVGQGVGNMICAVLCAIPSSGSVLRTSANFQAGGRTRLSGVVCSIAILFFVTLFNGVLGSIPLPVIAAVLAFAGVNLVNRHPAELFRRLESRGLSRRDTLCELGLTLVVSSTCVASNLLTALALGLVLGAVHQYHMISRPELVKRKHHSNEGENLEEIGASDEMEPSVRWQDLLPVTSSKNQNLIRGMATS